MTTYIRELIPIPERVHQGDFVLKLSDGVKAAEATLANYVVTPELARCFDDALNFIQSALNSRSSKAAYLHGSFGSGKSHFMAVLTLLLAGNAQARSIRELAPVVARHNAWTEGKRFLLVPYHMIGARNMETAILGGYAEHVRLLHPEAPIPGFYLDVQNLIIYTFAAQTNRSFYLNQGPYQPTLESTAIQARLRKSRSIRAPANGCWRCHSSIRRISARSLSETGFGV
jgi:hypothetical protein